MCFAGGWLLFHIPVSFVDRFGTFALPIGLDFSEKVFGQLFLFGISDRCYDLTGWLSLGTSRQIDIDGCSVTLRTDSWRDIGSAGSH